MSAPTGHPQTAHAQPEWRATPLWLERLQQLFWRLIQEAQPTYPALAHLLPDLHCGHWDRPPRSTDAQGKGSPFYSSDTIVLSDHVAQLLCNRHIKSSQHHSRTQQIQSTPHNVIQGAPAHNKSKTDNWMYRFGQASYPSLTNSPICIICFVKESVLPMQVVIWFKPKDCFLTDCGAHRYLLEDGPGQPPHHTLPGQWPDYDQQHRRSIWQWKR